MLGFSLLSGMPWPIWPESSPPSIINAAALREGVALSGSLEILEDPSGQLDLRGAMAAAEQHWNQPKGDVLPLGYSTSAWWLRARLANPTDRPIQRILEVGWPLVSRIDAHLLLDGYPIASLATGDQLPFATRPLAARTFAIPLTIPPGKSVTVAVRLAMACGTFEAVPLRLWERTAFADAQQRENLIFGIYFGAILVLLLHSGLRFAASRDRNLLYYALYLACFACWYAGSRGLGYQYLWRDATWLNQQSHLLLPALQQGFATRFVTGFLETRRRQPKLHPWLLGLTALMILPIGAAIACQAGFQAPVAAASHIYTSLSGLLTLLYLVSGGIAMARGDRPAGHFVLAWCCLLLGVAAERMAEHPEMVPGGEPLLENGLTLGSGLAFLLLTLALGDRANRLRAEQLATEQAAHRLLADYSAELEARVEERTQALRAAVQQTSAALATERRIFAERQTFLASVTHELRTPLTVIDTIAQNLELEAGNTEPETRQRYGQILEATARLSNLLTQYLDESQLAASRAVTGMSYCNPRHLLGAAIEAAQPLARGHRFHIEAEGLPERFLCHADTLNLALMTLTDNAVKYTPPGSAIVLRGGRLGRRASDDIWIEVCDQGPGLDDEECRLIFQPYYRGESASKQPGQGLGLLLARRVIEQQGGSLTVISRPGEGCIFRIRLPGTTTPGRLGTPISSPEPVHDE